MLKKGINRISDLQNQNAQTQQPQNTRSANLINKRSNFFKMPIFQRLIKTQCSMTSSLPVKLIDALLVLILAWLFLYLLLGDEVLPSGGLFKVLALVIGASIVGSIVALISLPALLGMLVTGIVLKSVHFFVVEGVYIDIVSVSREMALTVILIKAGLGLDPVALKKHLFTILKLSLLPCLAEAIAAAIASHYIFSFPWLWGFLLGFLLSPISPAVVVPTLLSLKERGYGEDKGIATLVIASSSIDDIFSISLFGIFQSLIFNSGGHLTMQIIHGPLELLIGIVVGLAWGLVSVCFPNRNDEFVVLKRSLMIGLGGLVLVLGGKKIGFDGAGPLACIVSTFTAATLWKKQTEPIRPTHQPTDVPKTDVARVFSWIWLVMQPVLFSFIGAEIDVTQINWENLIYSLAVLVICLTVRIMSCVLVLLGSKLSWKECLFVNLAWLPKATVQAALSPKPLEAVRSENLGDIELYRADVLLTTAVLAILITAPIGSLGITLSGTRLLNKKLPKLSYEAPNDDTPL